MAARPSRGDLALALMIESGYRASDDHGPFEMVHGVVDGSLVLGFVGTDDWLDWKLNLDRRPEPAPEFGGRLHGGYRRLWLRHGVSARQVLAGYAHAGPVVCCGHSLGGALAQVAAYDLAARLLVPAGRLTVVTFGSPRIWDRAAAAAYPVPGRHYVLGRDPVSRVPLRGICPQAVVRLARAGGPPSSWWHRIPLVGDHALPRYAEALRQILEEAG
jgi:hypothetical protein